MAASYLYYLANAGDADAAWLAELALTRGQQQVVAAIVTSLDAVSSADAQQLAQISSDGKARIEYFRERARQSVRSVSRLMSVQQPGWMNSLEDTLDQSARGQTQRLESAIQRRVQELGLGQIQPAPEPSDRQLEEANNLIVKRKRFGTLPLDDIPVDQREGQPNG